MQLNHKDWIKAEQRKHGPTPDYDERILELLNEAVKEKAESHNQGDSNGRNTED